jgi:hypothetical protein
MEEQNATLGKLIEEVERPMWRAAAKARLLELLDVNEALRAEVERLHGEYVGHDHWWVALDVARKERDAALLQLDAIHDIVDGLNCAHEFGRKCLTCDIKVAFAQKQECASCGGDQYLQPCKTCGTGT